MDNNNIASSTFLNQDDVVDGNSQWVCKECGALNLHARRIENSRCDICGSNPNFMTRSWDSSRTYSCKMNRIERYEAKEKYWPCSFCTYHNDFEDSTCIICNAAKIVDKQPDHSVGSNGTVIVVTDDENDKNSILKDDRSVGTCKTKNIESNHNRENIQIIVEKTSCEEMIGLGLKKLKSKGHDESGSVYIKEIVPNSAADKNDLFRTMDQIVAVEGVNISLLNEVDIIQMISSCGLSIYFDILRKKEGHSKVEKMEKVEKCSKEYGHTQRNEDMIVDLTDETPSEIQNCIVQSRQASLTPDIKSTFCNETIKSQVISSGTTQGTQHGMKKLRNKKHPFDEIVYSDNFHETRNGPQSFGCAHGFLTAKELVDQKKKIDAKFEGMNDSLFENVSLESVERDNSRRQGSQKPLAPDNRQSAILRLVKTGQNIFYTGSAGTGKSFVTKLIIEYLEQKYVTPAEFNRRVAITASTGIAATNINGTTIHSALRTGIPHLVEDYGRMFHAAREKGPNEKSMFRLLHVLIIDEISMLDGEYLDHLNDTMKRLRGTYDKASGNVTPSDQPFGGVQLIVCGDFLQLPPIEGKIKVWRGLQRNLVEKEYVARRNDLGSGDRKQDKDMVLNRGFAFQSEFWIEANFIYVELTICYRQNQKEFVHILKNIREGNQTCTNLDVLNTKCIPDSYKPQSKETDGTLPVFLYSRNVNVDLTNSQQLDQLPVPLEVFNAFDFQRVMHSTTTNDDNAKNLIDELLVNNSNFYSDRKGCLARKNIRLKVGAQVVLLYNIDLLSQNKLVNGSIGVIRRWVRGKELTDYVIMKGESLLQKFGEDIPEELSKAFQFFKSSLEYLSGLNPETQKIEYADKIYEECKLRLATHKMQGSNRQERQTLRSGERHCCDWLKHTPVWLHCNRYGAPEIIFQNGRTETIFPQIFSSEVTGIGISFRLQMPLALAWALTIHKSQGMSIEKAVIASDGCFSDGQTYVALSRVCSLEGLTLKNRLERKHIRVNTKAKLFHARIREYQFAVEQFEMACQKKSEWDSMPENILFAGSPEEIQRKLSTMLKMPCIPDDIYQAAYQIKEILQNMNKTIRDLGSWRSIRPKFDWPGNQRFPGKPLYPWRSLKLLHGWKLKANSLQGKTVCFVGTFPHYRTNHLEDAAAISDCCLSCMAKRSGGTVNSWVSKKTSYLVCGEELKGKATVEESIEYKKAMKFEVKVIQEEQFLDLIVEYESNQRINDVLELG